ncbi:unnamed protein product [Litomosoides sigmodontis]|uniref:Uncharacterized protein n=1 Tax=Litomosoides sigmodontis TaxID=42156 RepID=A0A3P6TNQ4_LITSI|nr:unnamed protein product [Litomosoides sigmodontis]
MNLGLSPLVENAIADWIVSEKRAFVQISRLMMSDGTSKYFKEGTGEHSLGSRSHSICSVEFVQNYYIDQNPPQLINEKSNGKNDSRDRKSRERSMMLATNAFLSIPAHLENLWEVFRKDPFSDQSVDFARLIAAYYLGFPLLAPRNPGSLPSLYEWPKSSSDINLDKLVLLKPADITKTILTACDERTPPLLLWACGHHIEAIYYCDQFRDLKSQAMLRFLEEQLSGLKLLEMFCEGRIEIAFNELDSVREITEYGSMQSMQFSWGKLADSLLQMDAIAETRSVNSLLNRILKKMCNIQTVMPLFVNADISLPRPPVYMCTTVFGLGEEQHCCVRLWILIHAYIRLLSDANVLLICIEHFCWKFLEINGECEGQIKQATVKYYNLLNGEEESDEYGLLVKWMREADQSDFEQLNHLFDYMSTFRSSFAHMSEFCPENVICWRNHLLKEVTLQESIGRNEVQRDLQMNVIKTKVSDEVLIRAEYIARCWFCPTYVADEELLAMNLKLRPSGFVCGTAPSIDASLKQMRTSEFAPRICHRSSFDIPPRIQCPSTITSRSFPTVTRHLKLKSGLDTSARDSWRKLDRAMQTMNVMIDEVEEELRSTSSYVKALLSTGPNELAESATGNSGSNETSFSDFSSADHNFQTSSSIIEQCKFVNNDRYPLDANREVERHSEIEKLNFNLLSPQPTVRNTAVVNVMSAHSPNTSLQSPDSQHSVSTPSPLPVWLKLLPVRQKNFLLSLTPIINQTKEMREDSDVPENQLPRMKLPEVMDEEKQLPPSNLKFELVTTIASAQLRD